MSDAMNSATDDSLRNDLAAALGGAEEVTQEINNEVDTSALETTETAAEAEARARDERGRFAKKAEEAAQADQSAQAAEAAAAQEAAQQQLKKPPQSWKQELKDHFNTLPPEVQDEILRRETDYSKGIQRYAEDAKVAQTLKPVIEQWAPYFNQLQVTPEVAFSHLMQTEHTLRTGSPAQKQQLFMQLAKDYGIELGGDPNAQAPQVDPNVQHAVQRVQQLETYIRNLEYAKQQEAAKQQQTEQAELQKQVDSFASSPDVPHFEEVRADMAQLLGAGYATDLKDAYEKACWARPDIRASLLKSEEAKRIQEKAQAANQAKAKAVSVTGSPSGANVPIVGASIRGDLEAAYAGSGRL